MTMLRVRAGDKLCSDGLHTFSTVARASMDGRHYTIVPADDVWYEVNEGTRLRSECGKHGDR